MKGIKALNKMIDVVLAYHPPRKKKKAARIKKIKSKGKLGA